MSLVKCKKCNKMYDNDESFHDGEVSCPFCHSKSVCTDKQNTSRSILEEQYRREQLEKRYNNYKYTCPMCSSHNIKNISKVSKALSFGVLSFASDKLGKCYECDDCKYKW